MEWLVIVAVVIGFYMAWSIGANDVANSMANAVGSGALAVFWAVILAGLCEFGGAVLVGSHVTNTIRKGIIDPQAFASAPTVLAYGMTCALLAAAVWLNLASYFSMPVSTTHSIVGAITGFGVIWAGFHDVNWARLGEIVASWFLSPLAGAIVAFVVFRLISRFILTQQEPTMAAVRGVPVCVFFTFAIVILATIYKGLKHLHLDLKGSEALGISVVGGLVAALISAIVVRRMRDRAGEESYALQVQRVEKIFGVLVIITSCGVAFAHGANDVANAIGPLAAVIEVAKTNAVPRKVAVDLWLLVLGGAGIVVGLSTFGYRVMRLVGTKITEITPSRGVAANIAATATVLVCSKLGLPISTTHTLVGAIIGVGLARGITAINSRVIRSIFLSWLITVPVAAGLTVLFYFVASHLFL